MGAPMARRLIEAGFSVAVFDMAHTAMNMFQRLDCRVCESPRDVGQYADLLVLMLPNSDHVRAVLFGKDGAVETLQQGSLVVDMGTGDADQCINILHDLQSASLRYIDAPVCRGKMEAETGELLILAGGAETDIAEARSIFDQLGETTIHVGEVGSGLRLKLVNNYLSMVHMVLAAEGLNFVAKLGIDRNVAMQVFAETPAGKGQLLTNYPRKVLAGDLVADFPLRMGLKDISLALKLGAAVGAPLLLGAVARELYALAQPLGRSEQDCTAMLMLLKDISEDRELRASSTAVAGPQKIYEQKIGKVLQ